MTLGCQNVDNLDSGDIEIAAGGKGHAVLLTVNGKSSRPHVVVQTGQNGRFGRPQLLSYTGRGPEILGTQLDGPPVIDTRGDVTVGWDFGCYGRPCSVGAALGNLNGRFARPQIFTSREQIHATVGHRSVALTQCRGFDKSGLSTGCMISVAFGDRHGHFAKPQRITTDGYLEDLQGDGRGDQLMIWTTRHGSLYAATQTARSRRFGPPHRLARSKVPQGDETIAFGPHGEAVVAWMTASARTMAAVYQLPR